MAPSSNVIEGALLQCLEAASLGMPFEVWKTRMGRFRTEKTSEAFLNVYRSGGLLAFWNGTPAKMVESATKGAILLLAKESIMSSLTTMGINNTLAGICAGAGGGICQVSVMSPCTFLVTAVVTQKNRTILNTMTETWTEKGIRGFYPGGSAIAMRQATNWASRQGFTEMIRDGVRKRHHQGNPNAKLSLRQEVSCGIVGGLLACWNHPFEVARIEMQATAAAKETHRSMAATISHIYQSHGMRGLFQGLVPRMGLGIWQTLFMVTCPKVIANWRM